MVRLFQKYQIPITLGIIPCDEKETLVLEQNYPFLNHLKQQVNAGTVEVALHGLNHIKLAYGEFGNVGLKEQYRRMYMGKTLLDSIFNVQVVTFIPPWNAYDNNTLKVMERLHMKGISSSLCVGQSFSNPTISYFPNTIDELPKLLNIIHHNQGRKGIIVVMFHHYDFNNQFKLSDMDAFLSQISKDKQIKCKTFKDLYASGEVADRHRMQMNLESHLLYKYLHLSGMIQTATFTFIIKVLNMLLYVLASALIFILVSWLLQYKENDSKLTMFLNFLIPLLTIIAICVWFKVLAPLKLVVVAVLLSAIIPVILHRKLFLLFLTAYCK